MFAMFNRVLIESLNNLEDEVRIIVTEILSIVLPLQLKQENYEKILSKLLRNLQKNL